MNMATLTKKEAGCPPSGAKVEVTVLIDREKWASLIDQGCSDAQIQRAIERAITASDIVAGIIPNPPILAVMDASVTKYY